MAHNVASSARDNDDLPELVADMSTPANLQMSVANNGAQTTGNSQTTSVNNTQTTGNLQTTSVNNTQTTGNLQTTSVNNTQTTGNSQTTSVNNTQTNRSDVGSSESTRRANSRTRREQPFGIVDPIPLLQSVIATIDGIDLDASDNELDSQSGRETPTRHQHYESRNTSSSNRREIHQIPLPDPLFDEVAEMPIQFYASPPSSHRETEHESSRDVHRGDSPPLLPTLSSPRRLPGLPSVLSLYPSRRHASPATGERRAANQESNNDPYNGFFEGLLNAATAAAATAAAPMLSANSCHHDIANVYQNPFDVPIRVCERCGDAVVVPSEQNEFTARSLRCPHSMQRDNRFRELFAIHAEHVAAMQSIETILKQQRALFLRLYEWEHRYSDRAPVNYAAQNNPCYRELSHAVGRYVNALQGFSNVSNDMTRAHRRKFVNCVYRTFPKNEKFFRTAMRHEICKAQPNPMLLPCLDALPECTVCGKPADVRLHAHAQRFEKRAAISAFRRRNALPVAEQQNVPLRQCTCKNFVMCLDCVLGWFWQSSERLQKSFAPCPTCKAEFCLEDIVRVCVAPRATTTTTTSQTASSMNASAMNVSTATTTATARQHAMHDDDSDESWSA